MNYEENHEEQSSMAEEPAAVAYSASPHHVTPQNQSDWDGMITGAESHLILAP